MKNIVLMVGLMLMIFAGCSAQEDAGMNGMVITQAHIYLPAANTNGTSASPVAVAFMAIDNYSGLDDRLVGAESDFAIAEVHEMVMNGDIMKMQKVDGIDIPNDSGIELNSRGYHLMLMGLTGNIKVGEKLTVTLLFEKSGRIDVPMLVTAEE